MSTTVHVQNISPTTSDKEVHDFFSFCGKITSLTVTPSSGEPDSPKSATVTFEKETAAKTALLLDKTQLGSSQVTVTPAHSLDEIAPGKTSADPDSKIASEIEQEDKPRSRIIAEYLAQGYAVGDNAIQKAIELDHKHGFSAKFTSALANFDKKYHATDKARSMDQSYRVTDKASQGWKGLSSYFEKAIGTQSAQKLVAFYTKTAKNAQEVHAEARRLADLKKKEHNGNSATASASGDTTSEKPAAPQETTTAEASAPGATASASAPTSTEQTG